MDKVTWHVAPTRVAEILSGKPKKGAMIQHYWCDECGRLALHELDRERPTADSWAWICLECGLVQIVRRAQDEAAQVEKAKARVWDITVGVAHSVGQEIDTVIRRLKEHYVRTGDDEVLAAKEALIVTRGNIVRWYRLAQATRGLYFEQGYLYNLKPGDEESDEKMFGEE